MLSRPVLRIDFTTEENRIIDQNIEVYERMFKFTNWSCSVKDCEYPLAASSIEVFEIPFIGRVCSACYVMYRALANPGMKDLHYFTKLHDQWKRDQDDFSRGSKRDKLGL